jgi:phage head maturation protease
MFSICQFDFKKPTLLKKGVGVKNVYTAIASTAAVDRHKEILVPRGVITESFMKNPVMLDIHNSRAYPVGKVVDIKVNKEAVEIHFEFADTEEGVKLEKLYTSGFMNAFSVGFIPKNYIDLYEMRGDDGKLSVSSLEVELPNGEKELIDLSQYKDVPYGIISKWELLEVSPVSVPANPEALMLRAKDDIVRKYLDSGHHQVAAKLLDAQLSEHITELRKHFDDLLNTSKDEHVELSYAVPFQDAKALEQEWDASEARACLALWASADKTGEKESLNWSKFAKGFGWIDLEKADQFRSYRYIHHTVEGDELCVVAEGLTAAMADLLTDKSVNNAEEVYAHLAKHYTALNLTAPEFKDYTEDELQKIRSGESLIEETELENSELENSEPEKDVNPDVLKDLINAGFSEVKDQISELEETVRLRMNILSKMFDELQKELLTSKPTAETVPVEDDSDEVKLFADKLTALSSMFEDIRVQ